jgi:hypothetical protein
MEGALTSRSDDLLVVDVAADELETWMAPWHGLLDGPFEVAFLNTFGVWFLRRPDGTVDMLDVFTGDVERVADSYEALVANVSNAAWREVYLLSKLVDEIRASGAVPAPGECYAIAPPAPFGGPNPMGGETVRPSQVMVMKMATWQSICAQAVRAAAEE